MKSFSPKTAAEILPLSWDLAKIIEDLPSGESVTDATVACTVISGTDASPSSMVSGTATVSANVVSQQIIGGTAGVTYRLRVTANTTSGYKIEEDASIEVTS